MLEANEGLENIFENAVKEEIRNIDWHGELDIYSLVQDELNNMDIMDYMDTSTLEDKIGDQLEGMLSELTIQRGA